MGKNALLYSTRPEPKLKLKMPKGGGLTKPMKLSADLAAIVGKDEASRAECIKLLWAYLKKNNLQDPDKKMAKVSVLTAFALSEWPNSSLLISHKWVSKKIIFISTNWATYDGKHRTEKFQSHISRNSISSILKKQINLISKIISLS